MSELPESWVATRLDAVAEVKLGRQRSPKNHVGHRMRPYLRAANVTWEGLDLSDVKEMNFTEKESNTFELRNGDVLMAEASGSASEVGKPAIWCGEIEGCCFQNTLLRVRSRGSVPEFLRYQLLLHARSGLLGAAARGVGIHHLGAQRLSSWTVVIAPKEEQRRVVAAIEEHFSRLDAADVSLARACERLKRLEEATLIADFDGSWPTKTLVEVTDSERPVSYGILMPKDDIPDGVPYVRVKDFPNGRVNLAGLRRTAPEIAHKYRRSSLRHGDVLVSIRGTFGRVALVPPELEGANVTQDTARVAPLPELDEVFLATYLRGAPAQRYFKRVARGVAVKGVNIGDLRKLPVPIPPLDAQRRIVAEVERQMSLIDALTASVNHALKHSSMLRRAVLEQAFRGELVPQDPSDEPASDLVERNAARTKNQP